MNSNYFKEYKLTYTAYIVLPANIDSKSYPTQATLSDIITKEIERLNKCVVACTGLQLEKTE